MKDTPKAVLKVCLFVPYWRTRPSMQAAQWNLWTYWYWVGVFRPPRHP